MTLAAEMAALEVPAELADAHAAAVRRFAQPGAFLDGATRRAIVEEMRIARSCGLCAARGEALSIASVAGEHESGGRLPAALVELVHRQVTDPGRITTDWVRGVIDGGVGLERYVEASGVVGTVTIADSFAVALGGDVVALPAAEAGEPSGEANADVVDAGAHVPVMDRERPLARWEGRPMIANIARALGLVPLAAYEFWDLFTPHYLPKGPAPEGAFGRPQIELVASRTSALNECFY
jgi:hypothetical protein